MVVNNLPNPSGHPGRKSKSILKMHFLFVVAAHVDQLPCIIEQETVGRGNREKKETERFASACGIRLSDGWHIERYHQETGEGM